jgi:L-alanine-DL-glutamate epimerase-like enolase superfamily enzyme
VSGYGESCPREYVTGETVDTARTFFTQHEAAVRAEIVDLASLRAWMTAHADEIDANPAAWCAIELSILDLLAKSRDQTVEAFLSLPPLQGQFHYSAVLGDASPDAFQATAERYRSQGFTDFKVKLSGSLDRDLAKMSVFRRWDADPLRVRVDANNLWKSADEAIRFLQALDYPLFAVEEPIQPNQYAELASMARTLGCQIVLDESLLRIGQLAQLADSAPDWLINLRVSKMGGLLRSLSLVEAGRALRIGFVIGAQVGETSLLTRAALTVAAAARELLVAQEGAFGTFLLERDVCDPPLMFGAGGVLDVSRYPSLTEPGLTGTTWTIRT